MAQDGGGQDEMGYEALAQEALRGVVKAALKRAAGPGGLPGAHHFFISFSTRAPGVSIPPELVEKYPDEMTIVLQHQYWDLAPGETVFSMTLRFGGQPKKLTAALRGGHPLLRPERAVPAAVRARRRRARAGGAAGRRTAVAAAARRVRRGQATGAAAENGYG